MNVWVGPTLRGSHTLANGQALLTRYNGVNKGPVKIMSSSTDPILASEAVSYTLNGRVLSFSEMMALPQSQLDRVYWLPWYNSKNMDTQVRVANVSGSEATVRVYIGGAEMTGSPFSLLPGQSLRKIFYNIDKGPVKVESNVDIVAAERVIYKLNNVPSSFSELMGLPGDLLDTTYWLPWYNSKTMDTQLRFGVP